jgi:hypothetical protein
MSVLDLNIASAIYNSFYYVRIRHLDLNFHFKKKRHLGLNWRSGLSWCSLNSIVLRCIPSSLQIVWCFSQSFVNTIPCTNSSVKFMGEVLVLISYSAWNYNDNQFAKRPEDLFVDRRLKRKPEGLITVKSPFGASSVMVFFFAYFVVPSS